MVRAPSPEAAAAAASGTGLEKKARGRAAALRLRKDIARRLARLLVDRIAEPGLPARRERVELRYEERASVVALDVEARPTARRR